MQIVLPHFFRYCNYYGNSAAFPWTYAQVINGKVVINAIGPNKLKIVHWLREWFNLSLREALAMGNQETIEVGEGWLLHLRKITDRLSDLGATVQFISNDEK